MRVFELAQELNVPAGTLVQLLRELGVSAKSEAAKVDDSTVAKIRARLERERRAGHDDASEALEAAIEDAHTGPRRRRRRRKADVEAVRAAPSADAAADAAESLAAQAAEDAAESGEDVAEEAVEEAAEIAAEMAASAEPIAEEPALEEAAEEAELEEEEPEELAAEAELAEEPTAAKEEEGAEADRPKRTFRPQRVADIMPARPSPAASAGPGGQVRIQAEGFTSDGRRKKDKRKKKRQRVDQDAVQENVQRVMAELKGGVAGRKRRRSREDAAAREEREQEQERVRAEEALTVRVNEFLTAAELAELIDHSATEIISSAFKNLGLMVTINQRLDFDQIELLLDEFGYRAVREEAYGGEGEVEEEADRPEDLQPRSPVVTVMGHVDHGKTSLLDQIRKTNVIAGEAGGITQHIGAYHVTLEDGRSITFLDTPGHAAFTAMRARGAEVTDLVVLVVAADDAVMPQTIEAISHAKNAGVPLIVAINKIDVPGADPARVKQQLLEHEVVVEEFGGDILAADVSAKSGQGLDDLLDKILLQAELLELKANPAREAQGTVIEAKLDTGKGPVATILVTNGTFRVGDAFVCGVQDGRVRAMLDERGNVVEEAGPAIPVQILGLSGVPQAGDTLQAMEADRAAEIAQSRQRLEREKKLRIKSRGVKLADISQMLAQGKTAQLNVVIKGDVDGSVQALSDSLAQLSTHEVQVDVIHRGVGAINESDVLLAATSGAIIIGFHVRPDANARQLATREGVDIRAYNVIYEAVEEIRAALEGLLAPEEREVLLGSAEVRQIFKVPRVGTVAGCYVTEGLIDRRSRVRVIRDGVQIYEGELGSLKRFKDDVREVREGFECGLNVANFNDVKVGDVVESYRVEEVARTLAGSAASGGDGGS
ncbi:MAG: translation initiation factor IF-2 [Longimicrobiales bacterium]